MTFAGKSADRTELRKHCNNDTGYNDTVSKTTNYNRVVMIYNIVIYNIVIYN